MNTETGFEKKRGVNHVEIRHGYAQTHVSGLSQPVVEGRLRALRALADAKVSLDFLKLTPDGLSFVVPSAKSDDVKKALDQQGFTCSIHSDRSIVLVHAVNIRDEEGLIAGIVQTAISSGANIDHIGDMHDRTLMVVREDQAEVLKKEIEQKLMQA